MYKIVKEYIKSKQTIINSYVRYPSLSMGTT